jgi:uncharacterized protein (TIGR02594 family)
MPTMITRREALLRGSRPFVLASLVPIVPRSGLGQTPPVEDDPFPPLPVDLARSSAEDVSDLNVASDQLGTATPTPAERRIAEEIIKDAPFNTTPYAVASYFRDVGQGSFGAEKQPFASGWPVRYNPVIIEFFTATRLNPLDRNGVGDATHWCAAFVNWCIARALSKSGVIADEVLRRGSRSASSGSFRCWGKSTTEPQRGDIVVWAAEGTVKGCSLGSGHVAFVDELIEQPRRIRVVGGNQRDRDFNRQAVTRAVIGETFERRRGANITTIKLQSFRTAEFLR